MKYRTITPLMAFILFACAGQAQTFSIIDSSIFTPEQKTIYLFKNQREDKLILFKTDLKVNTDGIPTSYHPQDLRGDSIALNSILNAVFVYRSRDNINLSVPRPLTKYSKPERSKMAAEAYSVIEQWRDANYDSILPGYRIAWKNVLVESKGKPCILTSGPYKGYYASATALKNNLTTNKGECSCNDQVNPFEVPTIVLAKNGKNAKNPIRTYGGSVGDLAIAYNTKNKKLVYAIVGDVGPAGNLGEGSVILNMKLKGKDTFPVKRKDTNNLTISGDVVICIIPGSRNYNPEKPYSQANIQKRILMWLDQQGFPNESDLIAFLEKQKSAL
ncbi:glycoside hydrolase family 75 protein [Flavihumibacter petaseus]|uniref:Uncharacterized protein n=1 Tax=Flavihumibacter petaseus NBRC 106054 TaxID=1220578 RepID=A0A0E9N255_9BACT|nr:glycoside hydrolase family 75 protein [Flavihumibacter petaseus]GAO44112.1 hypothetical protein FPE01S_03_01510 [Flavihumibacter petaseus NBRC 106054]